MFREEMWNYCIELFSEQPIHPPNITRSVFLLSFIKKKKKKKKRKGKTVMTTLHEKEGLAAGYCTQVEQWAIDVSSIKASLDWIVARPDVFVCVCIMSGRSRGNGGGGLDAKPFSREQSGTNTQTDDPTAQSSGNNMFITTQLLTLTPSLPEVGVCVCVCDVKRRGLFHWPLVLSDLMFLPVCLQV